MPRTKSTLLTFYCEHCKHPFRASSYRRHTARFCSHACRTEHAVATAPARFWSKVDSSGGPDACWPWTGNTSPSGYGVITIRLPGGIRDTMRTNRYAVELAYGPIPEGHFACHRCDNPVCCNPVHLFVGTPAENTRDGISKGRIVGRLNPDKVREIRALYAAGGATYRAIGEQYGCGMETVRDVVKRYTWKDID